MAEDRLSRLRTLLRDEQVDATLLCELLGQAQQLILNYTGQSALPEALVPAQLQLAVIAYNRLGMEGENWRHEGGLTIRIEDLPCTLLCQMRPYRMLRLPG